MYYIDKNESQNPNWDKNKKRPEETLLDVPDVMALLKVSKRTISNWSKSGVLKPHKLGGKVYFLFSDILAEFDRNKTYSTQKPKF